MIIIEDPRAAIIVGVLAVLGLVALSFWSISNEPKCPAGATAKMIHSAWYCVVPPEKS